MQHINLNLRMKYLQIPSETFAADLFQPLNNAGRKYSDTSKGRFCT